MRRRLRRRMRDWRVAPRDLPLMLDQACKRGSETDGVVFCWEGRGGGRAGDVDLTEGALVFGEVPSAQEA